MKTSSSIPAILLAGGLCLGGFNASADLEVSAAVQIHAKADFYAPLAPQGAWIEFGSHGRCWRPAGVAVGWWPYCDGSWVWTDCGWYWASDEPWAWACYHYGTWINDPSLGWVWVPGIEWAPAWVYWRVGGGFIGWTPCAPRGVVVAPALFAFVATDHFHDRVRPSTVVFNDTRIIRQTRTTTEVKRENRVVDGGGPRRVIINEGPGVDLIQKATRTKINAVPIGEVVRRTPAPRGLTPTGRVNESPARERQIPSDDGKSFPRQNGVVVPSQPTAPAFPPNRPAEPPRQGGEDREKDKGRGGRDS